MNMFELLEKDIGYAFKDQSLLKLAMTHPSYGGESHGNNQRLEFLGDAVLQLCTSVRLYRQYPDLQEGKLSRKRAMCVQEGALEVAARKLNLGKYLLMGKGEALSGGRERASILADAFEALLGAMFLDGAIREANRVIETFVPIADEPRVHDYKTQYQELCQQVTGEAPIYRIIGEEGPAHDRTFVAEAVLSGKVTGTGSGNSKKHAEQQAAKDALEKQGL